MSATITSIGIYHPEKEIYNSHFESFLETSDTWIKERTGIERRFYTIPNEYTSDMCVKATQNLSKEYNKDLHDIDYIIVATSTPDQPMPSVASQVQSRLNIPNAGTIDISSACAGFANGIILAKGLIASGTHKKVLVIGADTLSKVTDFTDRTTCILFGDGAGAVIVEKSDNNTLFNTITGTNGDYGKDLYLAYLDAPISNTQIIANGKLHQNGRIVYKWAVQTLTNGLHELAVKNNVKLEDIDYFIPHSANYRLLEAVFNELNTQMEKCLDSVRLFGNTSTASIPLAWYNGIKEGKVKLNDKLMLVGFGGGFTYAGIYIENQIE
jgi:3-oxoacyl-[acyl-carrier-protein] synthase-3